MLEDNLASESLPEKPENSSQNEPLPATNAPVETSLPEKIFQAGEGVFSKFGLPFKRGRGRPKNCGVCGQPETKCLCSKAPGVQAPVAAILPAPVNPLHDALFARAISSAVKAVIGFAKNLVRKKAKQAGLEKSFTEAALAECEIEPDVLSDFNESLKIVLEKYNCKTEYAPEIALGVSVLRMGSPFVMLLQTFNAEIKRKQALEGGAK